MDAWNQLVLLWLMGESVSHFCYIGKIISEHPCLHKVLICVSYDAACGLGFVAGESGMLGVRETQITTCLIFKLDAC